MKNKVCFEIQSGSWLVSVRVSVKGSRGRSYKYGLFLDHGRPRVPLSGVVLALWEEWVSLAVVVRGLGAEELCLLRVTQAPRWPPTWWPSALSPPTPYPQSVLKKQPTRQLPVARIATPNVFVPRVCEIPQRHRSSPTWLVFWLPHSPGSICQYSTRADWSEILRCLWGSERKRTSFLSARMRRFLPSCSFWISLVALGGNSHPGVRSVTLDQSLNLSEFSSLQRHDWDNNSCLARLWPTSRPPDGRRSGYQLTHQVSWP